MIPNDALKASRCQSGYKDGIFNSSFYSSTSVAVTLKNMDCVKCDGLQSWYNNCTETGIIVCLYCNAAMDGSRHWRATTHILQRRPKGKIAFQNAMRCICKGCCRTCGSRQGDSGSVWDGWRRFTACNHSYSSECAQRQRWSDSQIRRCFWDYVE